ncbi:MAG: hypothetical protein K2P85_03095 [Flavobacteriaceae bacterium]|nr:hypothetical protein [Flavobacteriaceae bacterium]
MRLFKSLFILLIGMISLTVTAANHSTQEQKQKTVIQKEFQSPVVVVNTLSDDFVFINDSVVSIENQTHYLFKNYNESTNTLAIITDVGWQLYGKNYKQIPYKEKLLENYNLSFKSKFNYLEYLSRHNC